MKLNQRRIMIPLLFIGSVLFGMYVFHNYQVMYRACTKEEANPLLVKESSFESNYRYKKCQSINLFLNKEITESELHNLRKEIKMFDDVYSIEYLSSAEVSKGAYEMKQYSYLASSNSAHPQFRIFIHTDKNKSAILKLVKTKPYVVDTHPTRYSPTRCTILTCNNIYRTITTF